MLSHNRNVTQTRSPNGKGSPSRIVANRPSIQGRSALGSEPGARVERQGIPELAVPGRAVVIKELRAQLDALLV